MSIQPLDDLERFEIMQAMFPDEVGDDNEAWDNLEDTIWEKFSINVEDFDLLVGHLVMCAPVMGSPMTGKQNHVLGSVSINGNQQQVVAAVKREYQTPKPKCDHDWEDMSDGTMACTYPECNATRAGGR